MLNVRWPGSPWVMTLSSSTSPRCRLCGKVSYRSGLTWDDGSTAAQWIQGGTSHAQQRFYLSRRVASVGASPRRASATVDPDDLRFIKVHSGNNRPANGTIELYDTTLRDGAQQEGISLSVEDKLAITLLLDELGIDIIEGGYAGANPKDDEYFRRVRDLDIGHSRIAAFGNTRHANIACKDDATMAAMLGSGAEILTLVGKASAGQVRTVLETTVEENLAMIADSVHYLKSQGREVFFDAEHFFDGYLEDREYALQALRAARDAGATRIILCDTNGGTLPHEISRIVSEVQQELGEETVLGIHTHNDTDTAVASTIEAVRAGAHQVQGCINGYGERTGNANLISVIGNLKLKMNIDAISDDKLQTLTSVSKHVSEIVNRRPFPYQPYVGVNAFTHKGGLHAAATAKARESYQHIDPSIVGNDTRVTVSELAGRSNIRDLIRRMGLDDVLDVSAERDIVAVIKRREALGYAYERAEASQEILVRHRIPSYNRPFELVDYMVIVEKDGRKSYGTGWRLSEEEHSVLSEATLKVRVSGHVRKAYAEGNGPVDALNRCLREVLHETYPDVDDIELTDYKVRVVNETVGTGAAVRVEIESAARGRVWHTVGASTNIIQASWEALADSVEWWLHKDADE